MAKKHPHILKQKSLPNWVVITAIAVFAIVAGYIAFDSFAATTKKVYCKRGTSICSTHSSAVRPVGKSFYAYVRRERPQRHCNWIWQYKKVGTTSWKCLFEPV